MVPTAVLDARERSQSSISRSSSLPAGFPTPQTLAAFLGVSLSSIYSWNSSGYGSPFVKLGNLLRCTSVDVELWLAQQIELSRG